MSTSAVAKFVSRLAVHFPPPRFDSPEQEAEWLGSIIESLKRFDDDVLDRACQEIIDTRGVKAGEKWFPVPAEIRKVCAEIISENNRHKLPLEEGSDGSKPSTYYRVRDADNWVHSELGRMAASEGWVGGLHMFIRQNGRMPDGHERKSFRTLVRDAEGRVTWTTVSCTEVEWLRRSAKAFDAALDECYRGGWVLAKPLAMLGETMMARQNELASAVLGGKA